MYNWLPTEKHPKGFTLKHFAMKEFKCPGLMDVGFLKDLDGLRDGCGFPLRITDSARTMADLARIYAKEIAKGESYPTNSAHLYKGDGDDLVRAVDLKPAIPTASDGCELNLEGREMELTFQIMLMHKGIWDHCGVGIETAHWHVDDCKRLAHKRPAFWIAASR
jgi:hypothetical protein